MHSTLLELILRQPKDAEWTFGEPLTVHVLASVAVLICIDSPFTSALPPRVTRPALGHLRTLTLHVNHDPDVATVPFDWPPLLSECFQTLQSLGCRATLTTFVLHIYFRRDNSGPRRPQNPSRLSSTSRALCFINDGKRCQRLKETFHGHTRLQRFAVIVHFPREKRKWVVLLKHLTEEGFFALHWMGFFGVDRNLNSKLHETRLIRSQ